MEPVPSLHSSIHCVPQRKFSTPRNSPCIYFFSETLKSGGINLRHELRLQHPDCHGGSSFFTEIGAVSCPNTVRYVGEISRISFHRRCVCNLTFFSIEKNESDFISPTSLAMDASTGTLQELIKESAGKLSRNSTEASGPGDEG
ncbi:hypothetical protein RRG08_034074 [Elysia crispata]|uniref:Uncharacterized protein n=1 Tax=Elysia crispata TaxID=231223 RepID=A0AAE0YL31_9GAST|nr:hypothetical protein RRG08_034074 [Elysia crispata]